MVTISDIAKRARVSPNTVSRVINGNAAYVRPSFAKRAEKIRKIAQEMGYMPNAAAQSMRSGKQSCISLLTSPQSWTSSMPTDVMYALQNEISDRKCSMVLTSLSEGGDSANRNLPRIFRENCVDGILINITHAIPAWVEPMLRSLGLPFVWLGSKHESDCLNHDDMGATEMLTQRLLEAGHKDIAYVDSGTAWSANPAEWHFSNFDRIEGYKQAMASAGLEPRIIRPQTFLNSNQRVSFLLETVFGSKIPTAVVTYSLESTGTALLFAAARKGIAVPEDLSLATFASHSTSCINDLDVSHCAGSPAYSKHAVEMLFEKINNNRPPPPKVLPFEFIAGNTIARPRTQ